MKNNQEYLPLARKNQLVIHELKDEVLIYDLKVSKAFCLNHTAAFVWQHADGETPVAQIAFLLQKKLRVKAAGAAAAIRSGEVRRPDSNIWRAASGA